MKRAEFIKIVTKVIKKVEASIGTDEHVFTCNEIYLRGGKDTGDCKRDNKILSSYKHYLGNNTPTEDIPIGFSGRDKKEKDERRLIALSIYLIVGLDSKIYKGL